MPADQARSISSNACASVSPIPKKAGAEPTPPKLPQPRIRRETSSEPMRVGSTGTSMQRGAASARSLGSRHMAGTSAGPPSPTGHLRRLLGLGFGLAVIVGSTIGVGILRTPGLVASHLHTAPAILALWIAGGVYTLLGALCLAELGTMLPQAGGYYVYARRGFGA